MVRGANWRWVGKRLQRRRTGGCRRIVAVAVGLLGEGETRRQRLTTIKQDQAASMFRQHSGPGMATFYCIRPCEKCSYCNVLSARQCRNCGEQVEQPLYLEDKHLFLVDNQRILATCSSTGIGHPCFRASDGSRLLSKKKNDAAGGEKAIDQLLEFRIKPDALDGECGEEVVEAKHQLSNTLESVCEFGSPHERSCIKDLTTKETGLLSSHGQEKYALKMDLVKEKGNDSDLSLDTEFEMYKKLSEMSLQQVSNDYCQEFEKKRDNYIPECNNFVRSDTLVMESFGSYHNRNSTESHNFSDFDYLGCGSIFPKRQSPTAQNSSESIQLAHCSYLPEDTNETLFLSAVSSMQKTYESHRLSASEPALTTFTEIAESNNDSNIEVPNGSKFEQVEIGNNSDQIGCKSDLQTAALLENINQMAEYANDQSVCTSTKLENNQVLMEPLAVTRFIIPAHAVSKVQESVADQGDPKPNNAVSTHADSNQGWGGSCGPSDNSDELNLFDESFVSAVAAGSMAAECYTNGIVEMKDALGSLQVAESNNQSTNSAYQTPDWTHSGNATMFQRTSDNSQLKHHCPVNKGACDLIVKVNQAVDAGTDFRVDFTVDKATTAIISVVDRATNTDIILMSKNRPILGQSKMYRTMACNTEWSIAESPMKQQSTQTIMVNTEKKWTNTVMQTADFNSNEKELENNRCKIKLKKTLSELERLKKMCKRSELQQQSSVHLSATEDENCSSDCCRNMKQRAMKAELQLLQMQYWMCQQYYWRVHSLDIEKGILGDLRFPGLEMGTDSGTALTSTLQDLKVNYERTRQKVLEGISLESLPLLSVELRNLPIATLVPDVLRDKSLSSQHQSNENYRDQVALIEEPSCEDLARKYRGGGNKVEETSEELHSDQHVPDEADSVCENIVNQGKDLEVTDDWFDAEENFTSSGSSDTMEGKLNNQGEAEHPMDERRSNESDCIGNFVEKESAQTNYIYVDGLPRTVTEMELARLFQKYQVLGIWLCNLYSDCRYGILRVASPNYAKLAVDEMNGREYREKLIKVHVAKISADHMSSVLKNHSQLPLKERDLVIDHATRGTKFKVDSQWESYSASTKAPKTAFDKMSKRKYKQMQCLQDTPTATGTFIPPNSANLSSFNKLMKTLLESHPEASRGDIIQALKEVKANNKGFLSGLALTSIVKLASAILKKKLPPTGKE
ncbi:RNA-binding protein 44 isoform X2 [Narcine bancroftii]|uniref:RNA-binding protein 44 isoform X2 n=1 Tax=Narcine bancroftii TaxID=1343680 RepID=UPI0038316FA5